MASQRCINLMTKTAQDRGVAFSVEESKTVAKYFEAELKRRPPSSQNDVDNALNVAMDKAREVRLVALQSKKEALLRAKHKANIMAHLKKYKADTKNATLIDGYNAYLVGSSKMVAGSRDSVSSTKAALHKD